MMAEELWLPAIDKEACTGCQDCVTTCPTGALGMADGIAVLVDPRACNYCSECETICPVDAISLPYQIVLAPGI